jgi:hypothetical protein
MFAKLLSSLKLLWNNPIVGYIGIMFAEWFYFFCRSKYPAGKSIPSTVIPVDANKDGVCDHCGQAYTVGMDKCQNGCDHNEKDENAEEVVVETKPKVRKRAVRKVEKVEEPQVAKPKRVRKATTKKTTTKKKTTKAE